VKATSRTEILAHEAGPWEKSSGLRKQESARLINTSLSGGERTGAGAVAEGKGKGHYIVGLEERSLKKSPSIGN